jgi:hypothetical protein
MTTRPNTFIDAELAKDVMGWSVVQAGGEEWLEKAILAGARFPIYAYWLSGGSIVEMSDSPTDTREFRPSSEDNHAMEVVARMAKEKYEFRIAVSADEYKVEIFKDGTVIATETDFSRLAPAIAKAALKAVRKGEK